MPAQAQHCGRERWELREYPGSLVLPGQQGDGSETWCSLCLAAQLGCRRSAVVPLVWDAPAELPSGKQKVHLSSHEKKKKSPSFLEIFVSTEPGLTCQGQGVNLPPSHPKGSSSSSPYSPGSTGHIPVHGLSGQYKLVRAALAQNWLCSNSLENNFFKKSTPEGLLAWRWR